MPASRFTIIAIAAIGLVAPALAQEPQPLTDLVAKRINANQISVAFQYDGGACEEVEPAELGELADGTLAVTFPTISTSEICTMQVVEIEVEQTIEAEHIISSLDVSVTAPDGSVIATGSTDLAPE